MSTAERLAAEEYFEDITFAGLDLQGVDVSRKEFFRCTFRNTRLQESRWDRARLEDCTFEDCDLTRFQAPLLTAYGVQFKGCKLMGVNWGEVSPHPRLAFNDCNLRYCSFVGVNLRQTVFARCRATEASFIDVDLTEADFSGSDLTGSTFRNAQLRKADFSNANGVFIDPALNRVKDVRIPVEAAVLLAMSLGMRVSGYDSGDEEPPRRGRSRDS